MNISENQLLSHIREFRRKFYVNRIIRGSIALALIVSSILFLVIMGEGLLGFPAAVRTGIITVLATIFVGVSGYAVVWPGLKLLNISKPISDVEVAQIIRRHFPDVDDKLVNLLELRVQASAEQNALLAAAIEKKTDELAPVPFAKAINLNVNWTYAKFLGIPASLFILLWFVYPEVLSNGATRLVNFSQEFIPAPPFEVDVLNHPEELIAGQSYKLSTELDGEELPADLYLYLKKASESNYVHYPMDRLHADAFFFEFNNLKEKFNYYIGNEEVKTDIFAVDVLTRPAIRNFKVVIDYPGYTGLPDDTLSDNIGDFKVLRGSEVKWLVETNGEIKSAKYYGIDTADFKFGIASGRFEYEKQVLNSEDYFISLLSKRDIPNIDTVKYHVDLIQDRFPSVYVNNQVKEFTADFTMFMPLDFEVSDDYGFSSLSVFYRFIQSDNEDKIDQDYKRLTLKIDQRQLLQHKALELDLMTLGMSEGDLVEYYVKVWDNDFITGPKGTASSVFRIDYPSANKRFEEVDESQNKIEENLEELVDDVKDIKEQIEKFQDKMLNQKNLNYDDKKELENMIEKHKQVQERIKETQKEFKRNKEKLQNNEMVTERTMEKYEKLQELLDKLNNPELDKYMEKLEKEMDKMDPKDLKKMMEEMEFNEEDLEKSLERTLELLKQLEVQQKSEELLQKMENLKDKQDMLKEKLDKTKKNDKEKMDDIAKKQEELSKEMADIKKDLKDLSEMKKDTETPDGEKMDDLEQDAKDIEEQMEDAGEQIGKKDKKSGSQSQQNSTEKMEQMMKKMQEMMKKSQGEQDQQNLDDLRDLLENLLRLSFRQEDLRDDVKKIRANDPQLFVKEVEQKQLLNDMYMVKDSLDELAKRVFQIEKFVTDESNKIMKSMKRASAAMDNKHMVRIAEQQHTSMTSINNLANMLTDVMQQMQEQMKNQKGGMGMCSKPGGGRPNMQKMSKEQGKLNGMMKQMMQGGKGMSPSKLAEMAKMQEMIRKQLKEAHDGIKKDGSNGIMGDMGKMMQDMKDTEDELMNRILTERTMKRQRRIMQRLLDSFKSVREKEQFEDRRESNTGKGEDRKSPDQLELEEYKNRIRQELLKSNQLEYSNDFIILIEKYFKLLEQSNE